MVGAENFGAALVDVTWADENGVAFGRKGLEKANAALRVGCIMAVVIAEGRKAVEQVEEKSSCSWSQSDFRQGTR